MKNAWSAADASLIRTRPQKAEWYLAVHKPRIIYSASLTAIPDTYPASTLAVNTIAGDYTKVEKNMTVRVASFAAGQGGSDQGITRVRGTMPSANLLPIAESGCGLIPFGVNNIITVMDQFLPWPISNRYDHATSSWLNDWDEPHTSQLIQHGPYVNMGPPAVGINTGSSIPLEYHGGDTWFAGDGTENAASWLFPDNSTGGTLAAASAPFFVNFLNASPSGSYVSLRVWDTNGNSAIGRRLTFAFNDLTEPYRVEFGNIEGGIRDGGYKTKIKVAGSAGTDDFPDLAEIVIFEEASYGNTGSELGGNYYGRSNIVFRGWIDGKTVTVNPFSGDVTFTAGTIDKLMDRTNSYDVYTLAVVNPPIQGAEGWQGLSGMTSDRLAWNLLRYRSTVSELTDFYPALGLASKTDLILANELPKGTLWKQFSSIYREKGTYGWAAADLQSSLFGMHDAQITGGSGFLPITFIENEDRRDTMMIQEVDLDESAEAHFLSTSSDTPNWVRAPGGGGTGEYAGREGGAGYFGKKKEHAVGMYADQQTLTQMVGNWYALLNNKLPKTKMPLANNMRLDSVPQSLLTVTMAATDNPRGYSWNNKYFYPYKTTLEYDSKAGVVLPTVEMEALVDGVGGSAVTFPRVQTNIDPGTTPTPDDVPEIPGPTEGDGFGTCYVMLSTGLARTRDLSLSSPTWTRVDTGVSGTYRDFILDPWHPKERAYLLTTTGVWKSTDMDQTTPSWTQMLSSTTIESNVTGSIEYMGPVIRGSINHENYVAFTVMTVDVVADARAYFIYSTNAGSTWNYTKVEESLVIASSSTNNLAFDIVPWGSPGALTIYLPIGFVGNTTKQFRMFKSTNSGATFTRINYKNVSTSSWPVCVVCPYQGNESGNIVWVTWRVNLNDSESRIEKSTTGYSGSWPSAISLPNTTKDFSNVKRLGTEIYTANSNTVAVWNPDNQLFKSTDGSTFSEVSYTGYTPGTHGNVAGAGGFPTIGTQYYMITDERHLFVSIDGGTTWIEKTGDLQSAITVDGDVLTGTNTELGVVVPVWVTE